ncbi:hypothetical protein LDENG_00298610, partial [Lucifuga dentata]
VQSLVFGPLSFNLLLFSDLSLLRDLFRLRTSPALSTPRDGFSSLLVPFFTALLKLRLAVLYFKVISSNFISCSKKFVPESAIDVITTSTWFHSSYSVLATVSSPS